MGKAFTNYHIEERSYVSYIKREIHLEVSRSRFKEKQVAEIDLITSEMTSNVIKHAGSGEVLYRTMETGISEAVFEILCIDKGPGMSDPARMIKDGVSTAGTLGQGLGAIDRLSTYSQLYTLPGWGTIVYALVSTGDGTHQQKKSCGVDVRALCVNKPRETVCGDGYRVKETEHLTKIFLGDGLGHGEHAKAAVDIAGDFFLASDESEPEDIIRGMHDHVRRTRGLVATIAIHDKRTGQWKVCGVGNISVRVYSGLQCKNYMSFNGTIGLNIPSSMKASVFPAEKNQHVIMTSDGIKSRWNISQYPSIFKFDHIVLASAIYKDHTRGNDDASVLIAKVN